ncbi:MAG: zf-HC2 domain-containing protein [Vicinamibacterales bacterium]
MHQEWTDQLSDYLDGELSPDEQRAVDVHLRGCASCTAVLNDLKRVVARAASATARPPQAELWAGVAARIEAHAAPARGGLVPFSRRGARRFAFTLPQLAAAAALLIVVSGGIAWRMASETGRTEGLRSAADDRSADSQAGADASVAGPFRTAGSEGTGAADFARVDNVSMADAQYDAAVADLEKALKAGRGRLDTSTITIVEHNLQIIDQAINQAREALAGDPANSYLSGHLVEARRRKLDLLRRATALATETN